MYAVPDVDEVVAVAKELGIHLGPDEAVKYREYLIEQMDQLDTFVQARIEEEQPPMISPAREPGYRPSAEEDPLNAWIWKCRIEGAAGGLLAGKTVSYKDHVAVSGIPMSFGSFALEGFIPDFDATVVTRVLQEGGTIIGKNVMNGLSGGFGTGGGIGDYGRSLNPHNHDHVTGGSSAGSAAAVAAGEVDISFGGDQGGSIRIPAAYSGTVGHKPTFGLLSHFGIGFGSDQSIDYTGPLTRTVEDAAATLQATAGYDPYDPRQTRDVPTTIEVLGGLANGISGLRIGVLDEGFDEAEPDVRDLVMAAIDVLAEAGADISKVSIPEHHDIRAVQAALTGEGALAVFKTGFFGAFTRTYYPASIITAINKLWASQADVLTPRSKLSLIASELSRRNYNGRVYAKAQNVRPTYIRAYDAALANVDLLVMPTCIMTAPKNHTPGSYLEAVEDNLATANSKGSRNTLPFNYTGHPALALPVGKSSGGLPVSMQIVGRFFEDPLVMRAAYAYQQSTDWDNIIGVDFR
ncbi:MAG: Asp-tRNA(Asn)/Glu-tRNA(Gln) amidotransferase GatCAB subunit A [Chloroflexi bacterium]|jgi:amidase|nr:amidase family protein [Dehalococcoidia bacterium]PCI18581.1 MAG: Asp-tRNA(Asn)/Glu-tRNA(Gln) amidotransferase GatCAB subunit A [SAR202 cluster bacterium]RUA28502.1 MAG: Asp-tRNA(Asn)/Glu-tRNA(Gln) amidotransferase GatCAB subunit A [Chloroflexota bacterium]